MIALVGGQTLPNLLPVRHYHPEKVLLVYTSATRGQCQRLISVIGNETVVESLEVDAYDIGAFSEQLKNNLQQSQKISDPSEVIFNLTGGTKSMVIAAYQVAASRKSPVLYVQSEGKQTVVYFYQWQSDQLYLLETQLLKEYINAHDVLSLYLGPENETWKKGKPADKDGGLFESAIAQALHNSGYETLCSVKIYKDQIDIDVLFRYQNNIGILEAKTLDDAKGLGLEGIRQLSNTIRHLGTYTRQFLVINRDFLSEQQKIIVNASGIAVIPLLSYNRGMVSLLPDDAQKLVSIIDKDMKPADTQPYARP